MSNILSKFLKKYNFLDANKYSVLHCIQYYVNGIFEEKMMKKNSIFTIIFCVVVLVFVVGCTSTKDIAKAMKTNNIDVKPEKTVVVDWTGRSVGVSDSPVWLESLITGNDEVFKNEFRIDNSYVIKYSAGKGKTADIAEINSRLKYNAMRSEELKSTVMSENGASLDNKGVFSGHQALRTLVAPIKDLSGHELVTQFWQEVVSIDKITGLEETEFIYYSVYKVLKKEWLETIKSYMQSVIPTLPDSESKTKVAASINKIYERTTSNDIKSEAELRSEISTKQEAIRNSDPSINPDDIEWLDVLETACNIIF